MQGSAKGKLLLFGEHAAVYGYPAIGIPLASTLSLSLTETPNNAPSLGEQFPQIAVLFPELNKRSKLYLEIQSEIPIGCGFGSSGALCVALARALRKDAPPEEIWAIAHELEKTFHGNPSGIDTGLSCLERPCIFTKTDTKTLPSVRFIEEPLPPIVFGFVPRKTTTAELVNGLRQRYREAQKRIEELGEIAEEAKMHLGSAEKMGALANAAHERLQSLSLSTPELDALLTRGRACGATGGKLSGAGGGGAYILFAKNREEARSIAWQLGACLL